VPVELTSKTENIRTLAGYAVSAVKMSPEVLSLFAFSLIAPRGPHNTPEDILLRLRPVASHTYVIQCAEERGIDVATHYKNSYRARYTAYLKPVSVTPKVVKFKTTLDFENANRHERNLIRMHPQIVTYDHLGGFISGTENPVTSGTP